MEIPLEAYSLAHHVYKRGAVLDADALDSALEEAAPLIVAAELERLAGEYWNRNSVGIADLRHWLRDRASELRGEGKDGDG